MIAARRFGPFRQFYEIDVVSFATFVIIGQRHADLLAEVLVPPIVAEVIPYCGPAQDRPGAQSTLRSLERVSGAFPLRKPISDRAKIIHWPRFWPHRAGYPSGGRREYVCEHTE